MAARSAIWRGSSARPEELGKACHVNALSQAQRHQQILIALRFRRERLVLDQRMAVRQRGGEPEFGRALGGLRAALAIDDQPPMRARPDAGIIAIAPIDEIMPHSAPDFAWLEIS